MASLRIRKGNAESAKGRARACFPFTTHFMAESTPKDNLVHSNDAQPDFERPSKKPRIDQEGSESDNEEPAARTEDMKASDLYLDTASAVIVFVSQC